jgi:hypothetical protein
MDVGGRITSGTVIETTDLEMTINTLYKYGRMSEHSESLFSTRNKWGQSTIEPLRVSPRNSSSIIRDFLILLRKLWAHTAFPERALLVLVTQFSLILETIGI